ncbi:MAG: alpha/beta hydrolase [Candidatus Cloacimonetes bacterium]|nr:alpha/beta hydrolase [Candidatus Cloacimonadota bacterium]
MQKYCCLIICILGFSHAIFAQTQGIEENSYEVYLSKQKELNQSLSTFFYGNFFKMYSSNEEEFISIIDSLKNGYIDLLEKFENDNPDFNESIILKESKEIQYSFDKLLLEYPYYHERFTGQKIAINKRLESNYSDFNNPELLCIETYVEYLKAFLYMQSNIELQKEKYKGFDNQQLNATLNLIDNYFSNQEVVDYFKYYYLNHHIDNFGIKNIENLYENFIISCKDTSYVNKIQEFYTEELNGRKNHLIKTYKTVDNYSLDIHLFLPENVNLQGKSPVIVYFSGGSWSEGKPDWNFYACQSYAKKGWIGVTVEYRLADRHGTLPFEAVMDAKSAIRWLRENADEYNIDPDKIIASGNSAGGHLVLATALVENWNEKTDNLNFSCVPNVLLVNSGVYDLTDEDSWIRAGLKRRNQDENLVNEISPNYLAPRKLPPTLLIHGTNDRNVDFSTAEEFVDKMKIQGNDIVFKPLEGAGHFIWWGQYGKQVAEIRENYLKGIGYE